MRSIQKVNKRIDFLLKSKGSESITARQSPPVCYGINLMTAPYWTYASNPKYPFNFNRVLALTARSAPASETRYASVKV